MPIRLASALAVVVLCSYDINIIDATTPPEWQQWVSDFGHDTFQYPGWITQQMSDCECKRSINGVVCFEKGKRVEKTDFTFCVAKDYLLKRMPKFDQHYLPPAVTVDGASMFDDNIAFALMANKACFPLSDDPHLTTPCVSQAAPYSSKVPLAIKLAYVLPYASFHEPRNNWRPLFFSKCVNPHLCWSMLTVYPHVVYHLTQTLAVGDFI